jgi:phospholipid/cholesterol/gamma-HCH transport system substrate-binding protein
LIGAVVVVLFLAALWIALTATNGLPGSTRQSVKVRFSNVGNLSEGDDARIADVRVGQVTSIKMVDGSPLVTFTLDGHRKLYQNAQVTIDQRSALGQNFVDLAPGTPSSGPLPSGQVIQTSTSASAQDLTDVLNVFNAKTRAALGTALTQVGGGLAGHGPDLNGALAALPKALPELGKISTALSTNNGASLTSALAAASALAKSFAGEQQQLADLGVQLSSTLAALATHATAPLSDALKRAPAALSAIDSGLKSLQVPLADTKGAVVALEPGARALGHATPDVRGVLVQALSPLRKVPTVATQAVTPISDLTTTFSDARPLAPQLATALNTASLPVATIAPYSPEIALFFTYGANALSQGDAAGHFLRIYPILTTASLDGDLPIKDPLTFRDAYPAPGQAAKDKASIVDKLKGH